MPILFSLWSNNLRGIISNSRVIVKEAKRTLLSCQPIFFIKLAFMKLVIYFRPSFNIVVNNLLIHSVRFPYNPQDDFYHLSCEWVSMTIAMFHDNVPF